MRNYQTILNEKYNLIVTLYKIGLLFVEYSYSIAYFKFPFESIIHMLALVDKYAAAINIDNLCQRVVFSTLLSLYLLHISHNYRCSMRGHLHNAK